MAKVLLVDDDEAVCQALTLALSSLGHVVEHCLDADAALARIEAGPSLDCAVVDVTMPRRDGFELCRRVRSTSTLPIVMLTARSESVDVVVGLECGADDYVVKPADPRVLDARIKAVLRRGPGRDVAV